MSEIIKDPILVMYFGETKSGGLKEVSFYLSQEELESKIERLSKDGTFGKNAISALEKEGVELKEIYIILWNYTEFSKLDNWNPDKLILDRKELKTDYNKDII